MKIKWIRCQTWEEAREYSRIIYLHEWNEKPFYWGKADKCCFGRRYSYSYRHWIEGCLRHGGCLYIGKLDEDALRCMDEVEDYLIRKYGGEMNKKVTAPPRQLEVEHEGEVPHILKRCEE